MPQSLIRMNRSFRTIYFSATGLNFAEISLIRFQAPTLKFDIKCKRIVRSVTLSREYGIVTLLTPGYLAEKGTVRW